MYIPVRSTTLIVVCPLNKFCCRARAACAPGRGRDTATAAVFNHRQMCYYCCVFSTDQYGGTTSHSHSKHHTGRSGWRGSSFRGASWSPPTTFIWIPQQSNKAAKQQSGRGISTDLSSELCVTPPPCRIVGLTYHFSPYSRFLAQAIGLMLQFVYRPSLSL